MNRSHSYTYLRFVFICNCWLIIIYGQCLYHPPTKLRKGNVFNHVCFFTGGVACDHYSWCFGPHHRGIPSLYKALTPLYRFPDMFKFMKHVLSASGRLASYWNAFLFQYQLVTLDDNYLTTSLSEMSLLSKTTDLLKLVQYLSDTGSCYNLADNLTKRLIWIKPTIFLTSEFWNLHVNHYF